MLSEAKCKFCHRSLTLVIDDDYAALGDPYGLMKLAACDNCADYLTARNKVVFRIKSLCMSVLQRACVKPEDLARCREGLERAVKHYMRLYGDYHGQSVPQWDDGITEQLMRKPALYWDTLKMVHRMFEQPQLKV